MWLEKDESGWTARRTPGWETYALAAFMVPALCLALGLVLLVINAWCHPLHELVWRGKQGAGLLSLPAFPLKVVTLVWLGVTAWTRGFVGLVLSSIWELLAGTLRRMCGERVTFNHDGVTRTYRLGPWRSERHARREEVVDVEALGPRGIVVFLARGEALELGEPDSVEQRQELLLLLREVLGVGSTAELLANRVPPGWELQGPPDRAVALAPSRWRRQRAAWRAGAMALVFALGAGLVAWPLSLAREERVRLFFFLGLGAMAVWDARRAWLHLRGRYHLEVQPGALVRVDRGLLRTRSTRYAPAALVVERTEGPEDTVQYNLWAEGSGKRRSLAFSTESPRRLLHLAEWLGRRMGVAPRLVPADLGREEGLGGRGPSSKRRTG
jgi:hypothetical protein